MKKKNQCNIIIVLMGYDVAMGCIRNLLIKKDLVQRHHCTNMHSDFQNVIS